MTTIEALNTLREWYDTLAIATGGVSVAGLFGFLGNKAADDETVAEANEFCLDMIADADQVAAIDASVGENLRDQLTIEQAEEMAAEADGRRWGWRWS